MTLSQSCVLPAALLAVALWASAEPPPPSDQPPPPVQAVEQPADQAIEPPPPPDGQPPCQAIEPPPDSQPPCQAIEPPPTDGQPPKPPRPGERRRLISRSADPANTNMPPLAGPRGSNGWQRGPGSHHGAMSRRPMFEAIEEYRKKDPKGFDRLMKLKQDNPEAFTKAIREKFGDHMKDKHPDSFKAHETENKNDAQLRALVRQYRCCTNDAGKTEIEARMRSLLIESFDAKQQARLQELEALKSRLKELEQSVESRAASKQQMIDEKIRTMTQGKDEAIK